MGARIDPGSGTALTPLSESPAPPLLDRGKSEVAWRKSPPATNCVADVLLVVKPAVRLTDPPSDAP
jgi:hypothetical protein